MKEISNINEIDIFVENLANIIRELKLSKAALNKKLNWPVNKLTGILKRTQAPLIMDAKDVRTLLGINITDILTRILDKQEIQAYSKKLSGLELPSKGKNKNNTDIANTTNRPVDYIIIVLNQYYDVADEFTKKQIIELMPTEFAKYNIEWPKNRLKNYVEKVREEVNAENKEVHIFHLKQKLPTELVDEALKEVDEEWLRCLKKKKSKD